MNDRIKRQIKKKLALVLSFIMVLGMAYVAPAPVQAATIRPHMSKKSLTITKGKYKNVKVKGKYITKVRCHSSNKSVATAVRTGKKAKILARRKGTCKIKFIVTYKKHKNGKKKFKKTLYVKVTVKKKKAVTTIKPSPSETKPSTAPTKPSTEPTKPSTKPSTEPTKPVIVGPVVGEEEVVIQTPPSLTNAFVKQTADFSVKMFKNASLAKLKAGKNVLISPESILSALLMSANGADGTTFEEMQKTLTGPVSYTKYVEEFSKYSDFLASSQAVVFHQANSIWVKDDPSMIRVKDDFIEMNQKLFKAACYSEPFNNATVDKINHWVKKETMDMIPEVIDRLNPTDVMCLINALAFDGRWEEQYKSAKIQQKQKFTNSKGTVESVTMLNGNITSYLKDDKALGFRKDYRGGQFAFVAILPNKGVSLDSYLQNMTGDSLLKLIKNPVKGPAITSLPKFSYDDGDSIASALQAMGIKEAFSDTSANFDKMAVVNGILSIGDVVHKTHIEVDENGTKAAAVTAVINKNTSCGPDEIKPVEIILNRPFIYAIVNTNTGLPIFLGAVNSVGK